MFKRFMKGTKIIKAAMAGTALYTAYQLGKIIGNKEGSDKTSEAFYRMNDQLLEMERKKLDYLQNEEN